MLPEVDLGYDESHALRVVAIAHLFYPDMTDEIVDRLDHLPGDYDLVVTTADEERKAAIEDVLARRDRKAEVRIVGSNRGRDISAFFVDCRDVLESDAYDIVVKVHSKRSPQDGPNIGELFKRHLLENLLSSPGYAANVLRLFQQHSSLGMVFPPIYHIGYPTLGHAWFLNKDAAQERGEGARHPRAFRRHHAAVGLRQHVRRPAADAAGDHPAGYVHEDFPDEGGYGDGALSHVIERLMSYAVLSTGHHVREVMNADLAAVNYSFLEYRAIAIGAELPAYPGQQIKRISKLKQVKRRVERGSGKGRNAQRPGARVDRRRRPGGGTGGQAARQARQAGRPAGATSRATAAAASGGGGSDAGALVGGQLGRDLVQLPRQQHRLLPVAPGLLGDLLPRRSGRRVLRPGGPRVQISDEQSLGGVAVAGFFFFSGFLITRSRRRTGVLRYFWRRCLRIMPAFWTALLLTAFVLAPIAWHHEQRLDGRVLERRLRLAVHLRVAQHVPDPRPAQHRWDGHLRAARRHRRL